MQSTYKFKLDVPARVQLERGSLSRPEFFEWVWSRFGAEGLLGLHEGTILTEDAAELGLETESWTVDAAEAPRERDWIGGQKVLQAELYFATRAEAECAAQALIAACAELVSYAIEEQPHEDWDAKWKASYTGAVIAPWWRILPPWGDAKLAEGGERVLRINPGAGFGTGTHETTQLCLERIAEENSRRALDTRPVLDFGSGSGILAIGGALLGAALDAVEIDPLAIENSRENARLNGVERSISYALTLAELEGPSPRSAHYDVVIANILKPVLLEFAPTLISRLKPGGAVILSGLIEQDVADVHARYAALIGRPGQVSEKNEWRAIYWESISTSRC